MIIDYARKEVEKICNDENYARRFFPRHKVVEDLKVLMTRLKNMEKFSVFFQEPLMSKYHTKELKGDKKGIYSLRVSHKDRMELIVKYAEPEDEIKILEVRGHYGE
ncbi:MAG: type II toxin-antitoxin system YoeB family toxin [Clostridiales bacterium]|jgi:Txe/YoeB family toxin of Txe-Axe toxin-antitoxin module|nr:type II toxin-antitoxin system YoeB family toxin [Clostridiales bacterium]